MENLAKLKTQLYVLRCIAFYRPHAHLAFLFHKPYRNMYDNEGQNVELCENHYGQWIYVEEDRGDSWFEKVYMIMRHNRFRAYHPVCAIIAFDYCENVILLGKRGDLGPYWKTEDIWHLKLENRKRDKVTNETKIEFYRQKIQEIRANAFTTWKGFIMR